MSLTLSEFLVRHREVIERRTSDVFFARSAQTPAESELQRGIPIFMEQLIETLNRGDELAAEIDDSEIARTATGYGQRLFGLGFTVSELVHGYGSVCEVVTKLAGEVGHDIATRDFEVFNRVLDVAIAESVTAHGLERTADAAERENERIGALAHELRNALAAATMSLVVIRKGTVGTRGPTADVLDRSLALMGTLIDRSLAEVRLRMHPVPLPERFRLADALDQTRAMMRREVESRNLEFVIEIDRELEVETDRQFLMSTVSNLVQNALKYTRTGSRVSLRARGTGDRVVVEVEDECGGWPEGQVDELFRPFVRGKHRRPGIGLGLSIAMRAVKAINGEIRLRDVKGKGCIFTVDLPAVLVPTPLRARSSRSKSDARPVPATRRQFRKVQ
jgi:signal transduction histidine kinase